MYKDHAQKCSEFALKNPDQFAMVVLMVVLSIQQRWHNVGIQLNDVMLNGTASRFLNWRTKRNCYEYIQSKKYLMFAQCLAVMHSTSKTDDEKAIALMRMFMRIPSVGIAKGGFLCQLVFNLVGCLDVHNLRYYGLDPNIATANKKAGPKGQEAIRRKVKTYIEKCHELGTERLWDTWCNARAVEDESPWRSGFEVSEAHIKYLEDSV